MIWSRSAGATPIPVSESLLPVAIRAWPKLDKSTASWGTDDVLAMSNWTLVFDTETTVDAAQRLRVGGFRLLRDGVLVQEALFYEQLTPKERRRLKSYAKHEGLPLLTIEEFREVFYDISLRLRATIVGFNLPFDLARLAVDWKQARGRFAGGFSLIFWRNPDGTENKDRPRLRIKSSTTARRCSNSRGFERTLVPSDARRTGLGAF